MKPRQSTRRNRLVKFPSVAERLGQSIPDYAPGNNIVVSGSIRTIGLSGPNSEPLVTQDAHAEGATIDLLQHLPPSTDRLDGRSIAQSVNPECDSTEMIALKEIAATVLGYKCPEYSLRDAIKNLDSYLTATDLRDFVMHIYELANEGEVDSTLLTEQFMGMLSGFRVEASFARLAKHAGFDVIGADQNQDSHGIDFIVNGIPFDVKSSHKLAWRHLKKHDDSRNRIPTVRFIPPVGVEDFANHLVIPWSNLDKIIEKTDFLILMDQAFASYRDPTINARAS